METKTFVLCGHEVDASGFGELLEVNPPEIENPYWEFIFKEVSILATDHTFIIIKNDNSAKGGDEKKITLLRKRKVDL